MSKANMTNNKRKISRKGKNVIRKSIAGVLMASALVIAAVPSDKSGVALAGGVDAAVDYTSDSGESRNAGISLSGTDFLAPPTDASKINYSYQIIEIDGAWSLMWKYKYYITNDINNTPNLGVVCGYNDYINVPVLDLTKQITTSYEVVLPSVYNQFVNDNIINAVFKLNVAPDKAGQIANPVAGTTYVTDFNTIQDLFPTEYNQWKTEYENARLAYISRAMDQNSAEYDATVTSSWQPQNPQDFAKLGINELEISINSKNALSAEKKKEYFCNTYNNAKYSGCTLADVVNNGKGVYTYNGNVVNDDNIYVVKNLGTSALSADKNGFVYDQMGGSTASIGAIANGAFKDVQKVGTITVGDGISYVGDSAFENSFISDVKFASVTFIGNNVFKNCKYLSSVNLSDKTTTIGKEAFANCSTLKSISIPIGVNDIGFGAFSNCSLLETVDLSGAPSINIGEYAFYNCTAISDVKFPQSYPVGLGKAAFAVDPGMTSLCKLSTFDFPIIKDYESAALTAPNNKPYDTANHMGNYILANRGNLKEVSMPSNVGAAGQEEIIPDGTFAGCVDLEHVAFADASTMASFDATLFKDVTNRSLYVTGPELTQLEQSDGKRYALPRRSTWANKSAVSDYVPYIYKTNGQEYYEVAVVPYRYELEVDDVNNTAKILSCTWIGGKKPDGTMYPSNPEKAPLTIPGNVAGYSVKEVQAGCFDTLKDYISELTVADDSIEIIDTNVFNGCKELTKVKIGNSVKSIGDNAFMDNPVLAEVTIGENIESIGSDAFKNCPKLETVFFDEPSSTGILQTIGNNAFKTGSDMLYFYGKIEEGYAPFDYAMGSNKINDSISRRICYGDKPFGFKTIMDDATGYVTLIDYPRVTDAQGDALYAALQSGNGLTDEEQAMLDATKFIVLPMAVESIDVAKFLENTTSNVNRNNWDYVPSTKVDYNNNIAKDKAYSEPNLLVGSDLMSKKYEDKGGYTPGLFSGEMSDMREVNLYDPAHPEQLTKGNDWIVYIDMPGVKYIPDNAFDSCERLQSVIIGDDCKEIGESAFQGCDELNSIGTSNNPYYTFDNFILYENKSDGTLEINTCLPARGKNGYSQEIWVNDLNDPKLDNVTSIRDGAFASCEYITKAELGSTEVTSVPTRVFENCTRLTDVVLPETVRSISKRAFNTGSKALDVTIPCDTNISDEAFNKDDTVTIYTYKDCTITANYDPIGYDKVYVKYIDAEYSITYLNDDLTVYEKIRVPQGYNSSYPDTNPTPLLANHAGWKFSYWNFDNPNGIKNVTENRQAIAVFEPDNNNNNNGNNGNNGNNNGGNNSPSNNNAGGNNNNNNSSNPAKTYKVTVENGTGAGSYEGGKLVTITAYASSDGKVFDKWTTSSNDIGFGNPNAASTIFIMPQHDVKVTATYKNAGGNNNNNGSVSGNNTGNNGNNGNNGNKPGTTVNVTSDSIDNNKKNLVSATVAGSTDNFVLKITDSAVASAQVEQALKNKYGNDLSNIKCVAFDMSLYDSTGTRKIENSDNLAVTVTLPIPDELVSYAGNNKAAAVINNQIDDKAVKFTTIDGVPCMTFTATHFSPYTVYVDLKNVTYGNIDTTPKTGMDIQPKWFLSLGLGFMSGVMFFWKDKKKAKKTSRA